MGGRKETTARAIEMRIRLLPEAERDLEIGVDFYESQQAGLGIYFVARNASHRRHPIFAIPDGTPDAFEVCLQVGELLDCLVVRSCFASPWQRTSLQLGGATGAVETEV